MEKKRFKTIDAIAPEIAEEAKAFASTEDFAVAKTFNRAGVTRAYLFGGRAHIVAKGPKVEFTYEIRAREGAGRYAGQFTYFVRVKREGGRFPYQPVGVVKPDGTLVPLRQSTFLPGTREYDVAEWAMKMIVDESPLKDGCTIHHNGTCGKCNRTLAPGVDTDRGFDPVCWKTITETKS
jgi:hypothetical protein